MGIRYVAKGREVWDCAWSNPLTGHITSGSQFKPTRYPSEQAALEAAQSLNENQPRDIEERLARFRAAAVAAIADQEADEETRGRLLPAWVEGLDGIDTL